MGISDRKSEVLKEDKESEDDVSTIFLEGAAFLQYVKTNSASE